ncbi:hypothetical protein VHUM_02424 [Vanrija humicola]|uniref:Phenazine biosynthesis protein n=1 Tax=Vanrija humicola TaxID=5417 RepID=A0A7D8UZ97_VANHU|nr:hypothetical protein VHUM_02424 [Vanrija humicola]
MTLAPVQYYTGNAFTSTPHGGGQAAILILPASDPRLQNDEFKAATARDFNLPMIAFHALLEDGPVPRYSVEWRLPDGNEAPLCGHASLVGAHTVFSLHPDAVAVEFETKTRGVVRADKFPNGEIGIELELQAAGVPAPEEKKRLAHILASAAGLNDDDVLEVTTWQDGGAATAEIRPDIDLANTKVDIEALRAIPHHSILTQLLGTGDDGVRVNSRVFIPNWGVDEDPVCGSGHSAITAHYLLGPSSVRVGELVSDPAAATLDAKQLSARGGALKTSLAGKNVRLVGRAWRTGKGELEVF